MNKMQISLSLTPIINTLQILISHISVNIMQNIIDINEQNVNKAIIHLNEYIENIYTKRFK